MKGHINIDCRTDPPMITGKVHLDTSDFTSLEAGMTKAEVAKKRDNLREQLRMHFGPLEAKQAVVAIEEFVDAKIEMAEQKRLGSMAEVGG